MTGDGSLDNPTSRGVDLMRSAEGGSADSEAGRSVGSGPSPLTAEEIEKLRKRWEGAPENVLVMRLLATLDAAREPLDEWRNHIPSGYEDQTGYGHVSCSCGWDSSDVLGWEQHINAEYAANPAPAGPFNPDYTMADLDAAAVAALRSAALDMPGHWGSQRHRRRLLEAAEDTTALAANPGDQIDAVVLGALQTVAQWDEWAAQWFRQHPEYATPEETP